MTERLSDYLSLSSNSSNAEISKALNNITEMFPPSDSSPVREQLIELILNDLDLAINQENPDSRLSFDDSLNAILAVKALGRHPSGSGVLAKPHNLLVLLNLAKRLRNSEEASNEVLRCVANALLLVEEARRNWIGPDVNGGRICFQFLCESKSPGRLFVVSRILFFSTLKPHPFIISLVENHNNESHEGIIEVISEKLERLTKGILEEERLAREAMTDLLKLTFNILLHYPKMTDEGSSESPTIPGLGGLEKRVLGDCWNPNLDGILAPLLHAYTSLPSSPSAPLAPPLSHVVHSLLAIPVGSNLESIWLQSQDSPETPDVLARSYELLDASFSYYLPNTEDPDSQSVRNRCSQEGETSLDDILSPLVALLARLCGGLIECKTILRKRILPDDLDRTSLLETRSDLLGRCLRLLSSVFHSRLKDAVGELLYTICDSDAASLASQVGYGNVAGFLFNKGIHTTPGPTSSATLMTPSGQQINPITGVTEEEKQGSVMDDMTEEEKEQEAERLMVLFDRLERTGAVPSGSNPVRKAIAAGALGGKQ